MSNSIQEKSNTQTWISIDDACKLLHLKEKTVKEHCRSGILNYKIEKKNNKSIYYIHFDSLPEDIKERPQSKNSFEKTLAELLLLKPEHISLYALTLEPETPLGKLWAAGTLKMPSDDFIDALFLIAMEQLEKHNYEHYEISNFALPGKRCIHNQFYWNYQSYVGMGAGSTSFINNKRYRNYQDLKKYICLLGYEILPIEYQEILSLSERMSESIILKMRMMEGIAKTDIKKLLGVPIEQIYYQSLELLKEQELLAENKTHYFLTKKGISLANNVFLEFLI